MSGKGSGKKRNRAAQSEQHGFQQPSSEKAAKDKKAKGGDKKATRGKQRLLDKLRELNRERKEQEEES